MSRARFLRSGLEIIALLLVALFAASAAAAPPSPAPATAHVVYSYAPGARGCASREELARAVESRLARKVFVPEPAADLRIAIHARRKGAGFVLDVTLSDRDEKVIGKRALSTRSRHCSALDDSLALVVALAVDVALAPPPRATTAPAEASERESPPAPLGTPLEIPPPVIAPPAFELRAALGGALAVGVLPRPAPGVELQLELLIPEVWALSVATTLYHGQTLGSEQGIQFELATIQLGVCPWRTSAGAWEFSASGAFLLGRAGATSFGFDQARPGARWLWGLGPRAEARYWFGHAFAGFSASLWAAPVARRYFYTNAGDITLYESPHVFGTATLAVGLAD